MVTINRQRNFRFALLDLATRESIQAAGGKCFVCDAGTPDLTSLLNVDDGSSLTNPVTLSRGDTEFGVAEGTTEIDVYIMTPAGHFVEHKGLKYNEYNEILVNTMQNEHLARVPFSYASDVNTEHDTGLDFVLGTQILADGLCIEVTTVDATETIDVGLLSSETNGDADGLMVGVSVATAGYVAADGTVTSGGSEDYFSANTLGALVSDFLAGTNTATDVGTFNRKNHIVQGSNAVSLTWTLSAGSDTAKGFILIPYRLLPYVGT